MPRIRSIKPEFPQSQSMGNISRDARLTFIELWLVADDAGRLRGSPRMLAGVLFPYDSDATEKIGIWLNELEREKCIQRYKIGDRDYIQILNWLEHQKIDHPSASHIEPPPPLLAKPLEDSRVSRENSARKGRDRKGEDRNISDPSDPHPAEAAGMIASPEAIYTHYPRKEGRRAAIQAIAKAGARLRKGETPQRPMTPLAAWVFLEGKVQAYARSPAGSRADQTLIPHPATWFNQSRYLDDETAWQHIGGGHEQSNGKGDHNLEVLRECLAEVDAGADAVGDLPWGEDGQGHAELVRETAGPGKR